MTEQQIHDLLTNKGFRRLEDKPDEKLYRKVWPGTGFHWYLFVGINGGKVTKINNKNPEIILKKIRAIK